MIWSIHHQIETKIHPTDNLLCHFYHRRPIQKVDVSGVLVSIERSSKRNTIILDDGTACVRCIKYLGVFDPEAHDTEGSHYLPPVNPIDDLNVGDYVSVKGILEKLETNTSNYELMVKISIINRIDEPNLESQEWIRTLYLTKNVYAEPFVPPR